MSWKDNRTWTRHPVEGECTFEIDGRTLTAGLENLSLGGALVKSGELPETGAVVSFTLPHTGTIKGTVVRRTDDGFALHFDPREARAIGINDEITFAINRALLDPTAA